MKDVVADHMERCARLTPEDIEALEVSVCQSWYKGGMEHSTALSVAITAMNLKMETDEWDFDWEHQPGTWDVSIALSVRELIGEVQFEILVAPWVLVMGRTWEA